MNKKILSGSTLKIIAIVTMVIDHIGQIVLKHGFAFHAPRQTFSDAQFDVLLKTINLCNIIGNIAFPIFCFLLVEGFLHTHNLKKYIFKLGIFSIISEPIYDLSFAGKIFSVNQQNVLFTLLLGIITLVLIKKYKNNMVYAIIIAAISGFISYILHLDGWYYGIALITVFYIFHDKQWIKYSLAIVVMYLCGLNYSIQALINPYFLSSVCSLIFISLYNGTRGMNIKYLFYVFYPMHLIILYTFTTYIIIPML